MNATLDTAAPRYVDSAPAGVGRAHAKAILLGEHAVVYGAPALAIPVPKLRTTARAVRAEGIHLDSELYRGAAQGAPARLGPVVTAINATLDHLRSAGTETDGVHVRIASDIPPDRGLGSSAAVAAAVAEGVASAHLLTLDPDAWFEIVQEAERHAHGNPSGLDARTVLAAGPIQFHDGVVRPVSIGTDFTFVLADSGVPGSTATAVAGVRAIHDTDPGAAGGHIDSLARLTAAGEVALRHGNLPALGEAMSAAHEHLRALGVSIPELDALVDTSHRHGALGAKLTGGGLGGCVLALAPSHAAGSRLAAGLRAAGAPSVWQIRVNSSH